MYYFARIRLHKKNLKFQLNKPGFCFAFFFFFFPYNFYRMEELDKPKRNKPCVFLLFAAFVILNFNAYLV